ncbi:MAG: hypothetical protein JO023_16765, partial [Chloroflexi bacterium]|nr:hypothetical protein [Chloroflexota bacterium]
VQVSQTNADSSVTNASSGFVVPYSPEYQAAGTDTHFLEALASRTGGRVVSDPSEAMTHDLPAVGAPRPLWPWLLVLTALIFVADVGVRRIRISGRELRAAYRVVRHRLGYVDDLPTPRPSSTASVPPVASLVGPGPTPAVRIRPSAAPAAHAAPGSAHQSSRLLAAKQRAARR